MRSARFPGTIAPTSRPQPEMSAASLVTAATRSAYDIDPLPARFAALAHFEFGQQIPATWSTGQLRADRDPEARAADHADVQGRSVEQEVMKRLRDDGSAVLLEDLELPCPERGRVDESELVGDRPGTIRGLQGVELLAGTVVGAFGQMEEEGRLRAGDKRLDVVDLRGPRLNVVRTPAGGSSGYRDASTIRITRLANRSVPRTPWDVVTPAARHRASPRRIAASWAWPRSQYPRRVAHRYAIGRIPRPLIAVREPARYTSHRGSAS